jgi:zinc/manganese transport system permease protein
VLFVDICLSQVAVLGSALSLFYFDDHNKAAQILFSLFSCTVISLFLSWLKQCEKKLPQEAIIGVTYAAASGVLILILDRLPHGAEYLKEALVGNILFVTWEQILSVFIVYLFVAFVHWVFRKQFWAVSEGYLKSFFWDFLFYLLFGVVITFSTQHAGVLVVFSILVIPAAIGIRFFMEFKKQVLMAWLIGVISCLLSFILSLNFDLPSGPSIVAFLSFIFFGSLIAANLRMNSFRK